MRLGCLHMHAHGLLCYIGLLHSDPLSSRSAVSAGYLNYFRLVFAEDKRLSSCNSEFIVPESDRPRGFVN